MDKTDLAGIYDYELVLPARGAAGQRGPDSQAGGLPQPGERASAISAAIENQMGLRLQAEKVPFQALVIDQAERPSAN